MAKLTSKTADVDTADLPKTKKKGKGKKAAPVAAGRNVWGEHTVCAVLRWMGCQKWTVGEAIAVCGRKAVGIDIAENTVRCQVTAARSGGAECFRGPPAQLTKAEKELLGKELKAVRAAKEKADAVK